MHEGSVRPITVGSQPAHIRHRFAIEADSCEVIVGLQSLAYGHPCAWAGTHARGRTAGRSRPAPAALRPGRTGAGGQPDRAGRPARRADLAGTRAADRGTLDPGPGVGPAF